MERSIILPCLVTAFVALTPAGIALADNPHAVPVESPAMIKIDAEGHLTVKRESISELIGRDFDLQELHTHLISLSGHIDESDDEFTLHWDN